MDVRCCSNRERRDVLDVVLVDLAIGEQDGIGMLGSFHGFLSAREPPYPSRLGVKEVYLLERPAPSTSYARLPCPSSPAYPPIQQL